MCSSLKNLSNERYPKLRDKADTVTKKSNVNCPNWQKKVSLWISTASVEAIGIMGQDYG